MTPNSQRIVGLLGNNRAAMNALQAAAPAAAAAIRDAYQSDDGGASCGGGSPFAGYSPAGLLTVVCSGPGSTNKGTLSVTGAELAAGSIVVVDSLQNAKRVTEVASDDYPQGIGAGGVGFSIMDLNNQNAPGLYVATKATRTLSITVEFLPGAVANDEAVFQVLQPGGRSIVAQACRV